MTQVFLSWSGKDSMEFAEYLKRWLEELLPSLKTWMSTADIPKGATWPRVLHQELSRSEAVIICLTPEAVHSSWVHFEAGAIAMAQPDGLVCAYLLGVETADLKDHPLGIFQATKATREETWRLVRTLNERLPNGERCSDEKQLQGNFAQRWKSLKRKIDATKASACLKADPGGEWGGVSESRPLGPGKSVGSEEVEEYKEDLLSNSARDLLWSAAEDPGGDILSVGSMEGWSVQTNGRNLATLGDARSEALWKGALQELVERGYVGPQGQRGEAFKVSRQGYDAIDAMSSLSGSDALRRPVALGEDVEQLLHQVIVGARNNKDRGKILVIRAKGKSSYSLGGLSWEPQCAADRARMDDAIECLFESGLARKGGQRDWQGGRMVDIVGWGFHLARGFEHPEGGYWWEVPGRQVEVYCTWVEQQPPAGQGRAAWRWFILEVGNASGQTINDIRCSLEIQSISTIRFMKPKPGDGGFGEGHAHSIQIPIASLHVGERVSVARIVGRSGGSASLSSVFRLTVAVVGRDCRPMRDHADLPLWRADEPGPIGDMPIESIVFPGR